MKKILLALPLFGLMAGCSSTTHLPITSQQLTEKNYQSISVTNREKPDFMAQTAGKGMLGVIGVFGMVSAGNELVQEHQIEDPANYIKTQLKDALSGQFGYSIKSDGFPTIDTTSTSKISETHAASDLVLDIETTVWKFGHFVTNYSNYSVQYAANLRLVDTQTQSVIAEGECRRFPEETASSPTYDQLLANDAQLLKTELQLAAEYCVDEFKSNLLSLTN